VSPAVLFLQLIQPRVSAVVPLKLRLALLRGAACRVSATRACRYNGAACNLTRLILLELADTWLSSPGTSFSFSLSCLPVASYCSRPKRASSSSSSSTSSSTIAHVSPKKETKKLKKKNDREKNAQPAADERITVLFFLFFPLLDRAY